MNDPKRQSGGGNRESGEGRNSKGRRNRNNRGGKRAGGPQQDQHKNQSNQNRPQNQKPVSAPQPEAAGQKKGRNRRRRGRRGGGGGNGGPEAPKKVLGKVIEHVEPVTHGVLFFDTHAQAKNNLAQIVERAKEVDVLNIVIKSEGTMNDPEILQHGRMFAGEAWYLIHTRRQEEGWYSAPRPRPAGFSSATNQSV